MGGPVVLYQPIIIDVECQVFPLWFLNANLFELIKYQCFTFVITMPFLS
ncbi:hypothetical protein KSS87_017930, partial [Heliosperma pusillum]